MLKGRYLIVLLLLVSPFSLAAQAWFAGELGPDNLQRLPEGGLDAIGGAGDWLLTDGHLCAVISGMEHPTYLQLRGGALVDLWHCDRANDQWSVAHHQFNLQKDQIPATEKISAGQSSGEAWVETLGSREGLEMRVRYTLSADTPGALEVETTVTRTSTGAGLGMFASLVLHPHGSLNPFTVDSAHGEDTLGFDQPQVDTRDTLSVMAAVNGSDLQVLLGSRHLPSNISYGIHMREALHRDAQGNEDAVHTFLISSRTFTLFGAFSRPFPGFWPRVPGWLSFGLGQLMDLEPGESLVYRQAIHVSDRGDAASILEAHYDGPRISGQLDTAEASLTFTDDQERQLTFARPDADGRFIVRLPGNGAGTVLRVRTPWGDTEHPLPATQDDLDIGNLASGAPGVLHLPGGQAMALTFHGENGRPVFQDELFAAPGHGERQMFGAESYRLSLAGVDSDPRKVELTPGTYRVLASRGPEYSVTETTITLAAGEETRLELAAPRRAVETHGLIAADFHVHSGVSFDSSLDPAQRVRDFVAQGGELLVATEHNITYDLQPLIARMGLEDRVTSLAGVELSGMARSTVTPTTIGHSNVFPVLADQNAFMGGTLPFEGKRLGTVIGDYKAAFPNSIFQLNHPRGDDFDDDVSFFNHLSFGQPFDSSKPLTEAPNSRLLERHRDSAYRDIDFDAMELLNGDDMDMYELVRTDWFSLIRQNQYKVATANSDSHASHHLVAYPRSYVAIKKDSPADLNTADLARAVARGALYGSTGPILRVDFEGLGPGQTYAGNRGLLNVSVESAAWVDVEEAYVWRNGDLWQTLPIEAGQSASIAVEVDSDSFLFVEVRGAPGEVYRRVAEGFTPFAFANPIFLDINADGWRFGEQ